MGNPVVRFLLKILKIMSLLILVLILILAGIILTTDLSVNLYSEEESESSFSELHKIIGKDEYVVAEEINSLTLEKHEYRKVLGDYPIGDTEVSLSVTANYKYFVKLSDVHHQLADRLLTITIPELHLSTPVAFDSSSIIEQGENTLLGKNYNELLADLRTTISETLENNGNRQKANVREKAARSLAQNFHEYFSNNNYSKYYDQIMIVFEDDRNKASPKYVFSDGYCGLKPCRFELEYMKGKTLVVE